MTTRAHVRTRLSRLRLGNFGDARSVGEGVHELRLGFGPGYRVYYGLVGDTIVLLLGGGDKRSQARNIRDAKGHRQEFKRIIPTRDYKESLFEDLQHPEFAVAYLNAALEEASSDVFLLHLRDVAEAWGGIGKLATETHLAREALYRMLRENGNPQLSSLERILHALGLRLAVARAASEA